MSSVNVLPAGFMAMMLMAGFALALGLAALVQRARGRSVRGPVAALAATAVAYLVLVLADQFRFQAGAAMALLRLVDDWVLVWVPVAAATWWLAARR